MSVPHEFELQIGDLLIRENGNLEQIDSITLYADDSEHGFVVNTFLADSSALSMALSRSRTVLIWDDVIHEYREYGVGNNGEPCEEH